MSEIIPNAPNYEHLNEWKETKAPKDTPVATFFAPLALRCQAGRVAS